MAPYDYVIVGAGSAGCVLANRLSEDPDVRVLVLEAGGRDRHPNIKIPAAFAKQFRTSLDWDFNTEPEPHCCGRSIYIPRGKSLGGSSSMNAMVYMRGRPQDYDGWRDAGCPRLGLGRLASALQAGREQRARRVRVARHRRPAAGLRPALASAAQPALRGRCREARHPRQQGLQRRHAGGRRPRAGLPAQRPPLEQRRCVPTPGGQALEPDRRDRRPGDPRRADRRGARAASATATVADASRPRGRSAR